MYSSSCRLGASPPLRVSTRHTRCSSDIFVYRECLSPSLAPDLLVIVYNSYIRLNDTEGIQWRNREAYEVIFIIQFMMLRIGRMGILVAVTIFPYHGNCQRRPRSLNYKGRYNTVPARCSTPFCSLQLRSSLMVFQLHHQLSELSRRVSQSLRNTG